MFPFLSLNPPSARPGARQPPHSPPSACSPLRLATALLGALTLVVTPFPTPSSRFSAEVGPPRATVLGYERDAFGHGWATLSDGCTTRSAALASAFGGDADCHRPYRQWSVAPHPDPYTGAAIGPGDVELDHIVPLSAAWDLGAYAWSDDDRLAFANDPRNLVVVSAAANRAKSDQLPSEWMPSDWRARCSYARQLVAVATAYELALPAPDLRAARRACSGVEGLFGRATLSPRPRYSVRGMRGADGGG